MAKVTIEGKDYYRDNAGKLVPEELIKPQDIVKDEMVTDLATKYLKMREFVQETKRAMLEDINHYKQLLATSYGVKLKNTKSGAITLTSFDGQYRIVIASNTTKEFNENIHVAKDTLDEYLDEELDASGASSDLRALVADAFRLKQGELDFRSIWNLTKFNIKNEKFQKAVGIIKDSIVVRELPPSLRVYIKNSNGSYTYLPTDFSTLETPPITVKEVAEENAG